MEQVSDQKKYDEWWDAFGTNNAVDPGTLYRNNYILRKIKASKVQNVADVGCGSGQLIKNVLLKQKDLKLTGFDVSKKIIEKNKESYKGVTFYCLNLNEDDVSKENEGKYDMVISTEVIEHLANWKKALKTIAKMVKKGGYVIVTTQAGKRHRHHKQIGHLKHFKKSEITGELEKHGIKIYESRYAGWPFMNLKNILVNIAYKDIEESLSEIKKQSALEKMVYRTFKILYDISSKKRGPQIFILGKKI